MRLEMQLSPDERKQFLQGMKIQNEKHLATHVRKCALVKNAEYIKHQFNDKPAPLSERMDWDKSKPVAVNKEYLIGSKNEVNEL